MNSSAGMTIEQRKYGYFSKQSILLTLKFTSPHQRTHVDW